MERKKLSVCIIAAAIVLGGSVLAACSSSKAGDKGTSPERKAVVLNETLTNAMSDSIGLDRLDRNVEVYMQKWMIKGASLAVMRHDSLLFAKGYGWADQAKGEKMSPANLLRLASVSKLITATAVMKLVEDGKMSLSDRVFALSSAGSDVSGSDTSSSDTSGAAASPRKSGILDNPAYISAIRDRNYYKITVEDLLRHKAGFTGSDPLFSTRTIIGVNHLDEAPDNETLIPIVLRRPLGYLPGTSQRYSNFGYLLLSKVIEKVSGMSYEDYVQENVLRPAGCVDFHIAGNYYADKLPGEPRYYVQANEGPVPEYNGSGKYVTRPYGGNDIRGLSGAGAWVASVPELMRFVASIDGRPEVPDIIKPSSVARMTEYFDDKTYSLGWNDTKPSSGWERSGSFSGTSAMIKYFPDGECWIMVTNTSTWKGSAQSRQTANFFSQMRPLVSALFPPRNLFTD